MLLKLINVLRKLLGGLCHWRCLPAVLWDGLF